MFTLKNEGLFLWTRKDCPSQCAHNNIPVRQNCNCGYFMIATSATKASLLECPASHANVHYPPAAKKQLVWALKLEQSVIPPRLVFVGHGYLQNASASHKDSSCLRYHLHFSPTTYKVRVGVMFANEDSMKKGGYGFRNV